MRSPLLPGPHLRGVPSGIRMPESKESKELNAMSKKPSRSPATASSKPGAGEGGETTAPGPAPGPAAGPMDPRLLEQIVKLMAANDLNTVDVRDGQRRVILKRGPALPAVTYAAVAAPQAAPLPQAAPPASAPGSAGGTTAPGAPGAGANNDEAGLVAIKSEM